MVQEEKVELGEFENVLLIAAHPDDPEFMAGVKVMSLILFISPVFISVGIYYTTYRIKTTPWFCHDNINARPLCVNIVLMR